ncbi:MAG: VOC family protein [Gemmatimonadetes bacterium]|nr:VOC family protein [Gemmatimonadota bacterium]
MTTLPYGIQPSAYRLPETTRLGRVRLQVTSLARSLDFYTAVLGFRVIARHDDYATLGAHGDDRVIIELRAGAAKSVPRGGRLGLFHFAILLPDRASLGRFLVHLVEIGAQAGSSDHLVSEAIYLSDPDGLGIEVYTDRPRESWQHAGRELTMATIPLDARAVAAAGADAPWSGMPAGTTLGHMHLHVGSLEEARAFYHEALGFDLVVWSYPGALFFSAGGYHHHLGTNTWAAGRPGAAADEARLVDWEIVLPDLAALDAAVAQLTSRGFTPVAPATGWSFRDPWGTQFTLRAER